MNGANAQAAGGNEQAAAAAIGAVNAVGALPGDWLKNFKLVCLILLMLLNIFQTIALPFISTNTTSRIPGSGTGLMCPCYNWTIN